MQVGVIKEKQASESRVAISPEVVKLFNNLGIDVHIEAGAGDKSGFSDDIFKESGAKIGSDASKILKASDIVFKVNAPTTAEVTNIKKNALVLAHMAQENAVIKKCSEQKLTAFAMEYVPRITRAQNMDILSSQSNLAGYRAVIEAMYHYQRVIPMMTTAAGSIKPSKVMILGAGVAGLQAIATAKRMGAIVSAFDVRKAAKEQVESLGASFIEVPSDEDAENKEGYAKEVSEEYKQKQATLIHETAKEQDIIITTALIPGKKAPLLINKDIVADMKDGAVIVDLAAPAGGNCELTQKGKIKTVERGIKIIGHTNITSFVAEDASRLYARNLYNFIEPLINKKYKRIKIQFDDEIVQASLLTHDGRIVHPMYKKSANND